MTTVREENLAWLAKRGFVVAKSLPTKRGDGPDALRPLEEIARRAMAIEAVFTWVTGQGVPSRHVRDYAKRNDLESAMPPEEREMFRADREKARANVDTIGWRLENLWPLLWVLGFDEEPTLDGAMVGPPTIKALVRFLPTAEGGLRELLKKAKPRTLAEVSALEDRFYCCHNAVRSAQLGGSTVPEGFHPVMNGGVIHERRHALTWCLSPGVAWNDTDLST